MTESAQVPDDGQWRAVTDVGRRAVDLIAHDPSSVLLVSDFDGTLAPIVANPLDSRMAPRSRAALDALGCQLGQVAVVTGRAVDVVRGLGRFDEPGFARLVVLGQYGQERWDAATGVVDVPPAPPSVRAALAELGQLLASESAGADLTGVALEDKGRAIGVHTRRARRPDEAFAWLLAPVTEIAQRHGLTVEPGRNVIEVRSSTISKGDAVASLVDEFRPRVVIMMGDDLGDVPAFEAVASLREKGIDGIRVVAGAAEQPSVAAHADVLCGGTDGVSSWLEAVLAAIPMDR